MVRLLHIPRSQLLLVCLVPVALGLLAVLLGQDTNWDLRNYHRYNPWALLNGRWTQDLAPAGMQTYFNPLLDLHFWVLTEHLPPKLGGFLVGLLQGLCLLPLVAIARSLLPTDAKPHLSIALSVAACLGGAIFLHQLGTSIGDSSSALPMLIGLALLLSALAEPRASAALWSCIGAGFAAGLSAGLKLTNAPYALAAFLALLLAGGDMKRRLREALAFGIACLAGLTLSAGFWFLLMEQQFGNPLFPQFNKLFDAELAGPVSVVDNRWRPQGLTELLLFPFVFTLKGQRISEAPMIQLLWPLVYLLMGALAVKATLGRWNRDRLNQAGAAGPAAERFFLLFLTFGYLVWMALFSIGRYLVVLELLLPLACWLLLHRSCKARLARWLATVAIAMGILFTLSHLDASRRADWSKSSFHVQPPSISEPTRASVLILGLPQAWLLPDFPPELAYIALGSNFPESNAFEQRARTIIRRRGGPLYALIPASEEPLVQRWHQLAAWLDDFAEERQIRFHGRGCSLLAWSTGLTPFARAVDKSPALCSFLVPPATIAPELQDLALAHEQAVSAARYGVLVDTSTCKRHSARIGQQAHDYQLCMARLNER